MNDEYLWQKSGEDPEIAQLEKALSVLRYRESEPPVLPVPTAEASSHGWRFRLAFAVPAFAAVVIAAGAFFLLADRTDDYEVTFVHNPEPVVSEQPDQTPQSDVQPLPAIKPPPPQPKQPVRRAQPVVQFAALSRPRRPVAKTPLRKTGTVALTKQERYAYEQLMIALSISSSKLNIVRNTINGVDESDDAPKQNNR